MEACMAISNSTLNITIHFPLTLFLAVVMQMGERKKRQREISNLAINFIFNWENWCMLILKIMSCLFLDCSQKMVYFSLSEMKTKPLILNPKLVFLITVLIKSLIFWKSCSFFLTFFFAENVESDLGKRRLLFNSSRKHTHTLNGFKSIQISA